MPPQVPMARPRRSARARPLPGCCCAGKVSFGMVSNWSSFAGDLVPLDGCEMVIHLPVKNPASIMWGEIVPFTSGAVSARAVRRVSNGGERLGRWLFDH